jgi:DNA repair photolyase
MKWVVFMEYIKTRTIMTKSDQGNRWFGIDYHMNLYKGCSFGCIYCDSRSDAHTRDFDKIRSKENVLEILEAELASKSVKGVVSFGTLSDPYNKEEKKCEITRGALELIKKYGFGVSIDTKSDLILRDIDLLKDIQKNNNVIIKISITTTDDELAKFLEPKVISTTKRLEVVKKLRENGIYAGILLMPVLPFVTDSEENIKSCVKASFDVGAKFIYTKMGVTLRKNTREYYYQHIDKKYPKLSLDYQGVYEKNTVCNSLKYRSLLEVFINECNHYHLLCDMGEIIDDYKRVIPTTKQISLF